MKIKFDVDNELLCKLYACKLFSDEYSFDSIYGSIKSCVPFKDWVNEFARLVLSDYCELTIINFKKTEKELQSWQEE